MEAASPWLLAVNRWLNDSSLKAIYEAEAVNYLFRVYLIGESSWLVVSWPGSNRIAFRMAYSPNDDLELKKITGNDLIITFRFSSLMGEYQTVLVLPSKTGNLPVFRLTTTLKTAGPLLIPFWPRDIIPLGSAGSDVLANGDVKVKQVGTRSGQLYFNLTRPKGGSVLYL